MNIEKCANCLVHGWKQPDSATTLLTCKNCESIKYCSNECQDEHWAKVHKNHCKYFADPAQNEDSQHKETDCSICLKAAEVGESRLKEVDSPNYECIFKVEIPQYLVHPHPFPVIGQEGDIYEKGIIVLWLLVRKFQLIHPQLALSYHKEFLELETAFLEKRVAIWRDRKIYPQPEARVVFTRIKNQIDDLDNLDDVTEDTLEDEFQLWSIIMLVEEIVDNVKHINWLKFLKDPLADLLDDVKELLSKFMENSSKYLTVASKVLEALMNQVIPYEEVLKIVGDGSLEKKCRHCSKEVDISSDVDIYLDPLLLGKYFCFSQGCQEKEEAASFDYSFITAEMKFMWKLRRPNMCDFCFQRTPVKQREADMSDIHRCRHCKTTMYCSRDCLYKDDQVHVNVCKKDKEGRKKKMGGSARRKAATERNERMVLKVREELKV